MSKKPTHAAIRINGQFMVVPSHLVQHMVEALTFDDLCGISEEYYFSGDYSKLDPEKIRQDFEVRFFSIASCVEAKLANLAADRDSQKSSAEYYRRRATETETKLAELQKKIDDFLCPKPPKADHGTDSL